MSLLEIQKISKSFGNVQVLDNVSLDVEAGEIHSIIGENGAGKSTFLKIIAGIIRPNSGSIFLNGENITGFNPSTLFKKGISVAFQEMSLFDNLSVAENLFIGKLYRYKNIYINKNKIYEDASELLDKFGINDLDPQKMVADISSEYKQIIEILKTIRSDAKVICFDEPTAALTKESAEKLFILLNELKKKGIAVIYVSHNFDEVLNLSDRITVLRDGKKINTINSEDANKDILHELVAGRPARYLKKEVVNIGKREDTPLLEVVNIGDGKKVFDISLSVYRGEILGITGLVGSGRSELAWLIFGIRERSSGSIFVRGKEMNHVSPDKMIEEGIYYLPEDRRTMGLFLNQNITMNVTISKLEKISNKGVINFGKERELTGELTKKLRVKYADFNQNVINLSGGNQQKLLFSKCLFTEPDVLILDEPTKGIDVGAKEEIYELIRKLAEEGLGIIVISSEVEEITLLSHKVFVMGEGKIIGTFQGKEINEANITSCYLGISR